MELPCKNFNPNLCDHYLVRKQRFCRAEKRHGSYFCHTHTVSVPSSGTHDASNQNTNTSASATSNGTDVVRKEVIMRSQCDKSLRVPCPINPNHTVYLSRMEKHIQICPDTRFVGRTLPYFSENRHANRGLWLSHSAATSEGIGGHNAFPSEDSAIENETGTRCTHKNLSQEELEGLITRVNLCYADHIRDQIVVLEMERGVSGATEAPEAAEGNTHKSKKHAPRHQGLLRCLGEAAARYNQKLLQSHFHGLLQQPRRYLSGFLELGAGKAGLSVALQEVLVGYLALGDVVKDEGTPCMTTLEQQQPFLRHVVSRPSLVVVDMAGFRRKRDARVSHSEIPLCRLRINLKDLNLTKAFTSKAIAVALAPPNHTTCSDVAEKDDEGIPGKVICDTSRDADIQKVHDWVVLGKHLCGACTDFALSCITEAGLKSRACVDMRLVVLATCYHYLCELRHFNLLVGSSVATSADQPLEAVLRLPETDFAVTAREFACLASMSSWAVSGAFVDESRRKVGYHSKRILDSFRMSFLRQHGYVAWMCQYTEREVTEENVCIVAYKNV